MDFLLGLSTRETETRRPVVHRQKRTFSLSVPRAESCWECTVRAHVEDLKLCHSLTYSLTHMIKCFVRLIHGLFGIEMSTLILCWWRLQQVLLFPAKFIYPNATRIFGHEFCIKPGVVARLNDILNGDGYIATGIGHDKYRVSSLF